MDTNYESYIPGVLSGTKEFKALDQTVDAFFNNHAWPDVEQQFDNQFIATADEDGIEYFEELCGLTPGEGETLESRRALVLAKWIDQLPYNYSALVTKLNTICGEGGYELLPYFDQMKIGLYTHSVKNITTVENMLREVIPCNIVMEIHNELAEVLNTDAVFGGVVTTVKEFYLSTVDTSAQTVYATLNFGTSVTRNKHIIIGG